MHCRRNVDERPPWHLTLTSTHLLDHVGAELLHRQRADVPSELPDNRIAEAVVVQVQDVLNDLRPASVSERRRKLQLRRETCTHIVAVRILNERECVVRDLIHKLHALMLRGVVDAPLEYAATVAVGGNLDAVGRDSIIDKLQTPQVNIERRAKKFPQQSLTWLSSSPKNGIIILMEDLHQYIRDNCNSFIKFPSWLI